MIGSRTFRTLTALLLAMTVGALILMLMETAPIQTKANYLAALAPAPDGAASVVADTDVPAQPAKWRNVVVHSTGGEPADIAQRTHFVIEAGPNGGPVTIRATALWKRQMEGHHVYVPWRDFNADSIGICLVGDFSRRPPAESQFQGLLRLVKTLQGSFRIPADRVYLLNDLDAGSASPGREFPARRFAENLLHAE